MLFPSLLGLGFLSTARAVTVYGQIPFGQTSGLATATYTGGGPLPTGNSTLNAAYDETILIPPQPPQDQMREFTLNLAATNASVPNLSIMQHGSFYGFSIEMSVLTQLMGKNASHIQVPFLNLMAQIQQRAGGVHIRMGGNTQDFAYWVDSIPNGHATTKADHDTKNPTLTPAVLYSDELFHLAANISSLVNVRWYLGIPFNDTNWRLTVAEKGQAMLGDHLIGLQAGNEPDYYLAHGHRQEPYGPNEYSNEFAALVKAVQDNPNIPIKNMLIGPSLASGPWTPEQLFDTGYLEKFKDSLSVVTMEHYPSNNCFVQFNVGTYVDPQSTFPQFLSHNAALNLVQPYRHSAELARGLGKPFVMFETNSATCGGLPGVSDSFGAGLWALDYGLTMAAANFSGALLHIGGQNVYYNPFTAPPTNQSSFNQWTVGAIYYSVIIVAEIFGKSNVSQIVDVSNSGIYTPSYAIYDGGALSKVALFNFIDDPSGGHDVTGTVTVAGGQVPAQVWVKYFLASSVSVKTNLTWAGQTYGNKFHVDGRPKGDLNITTLPCNTGTNTCSIPLKAPSFALVFLTDPSLPSAGNGGNGDTGGAVTFETTALTKTVNTATVDPSVLATSNGHSGKERLGMGSTSPGSISKAVGRGVGMVGVVVLAMGVGAGVVLAGWAR
ncbi:glycoside hydrolase family 79 protein [Lyophyllum atratum]|nr:glycoside hydrolase family 79 protein [Lyophyllum atratum]